MRLPLAVITLLAIASAAAAPGLALAAAAPTRSPLPTPSPTATVGGWKVGSMSARVDGDAFVVTGTAENRGAALAAVASVELFAAPGVSAGKGGAALKPSPVPQGTNASFEVRIPIEQIVRRYTVTVRPANNPRAALAEARGEFKDVQQFAAIAAKHLTVAIQTTDPTPGPKTLIAVVTNNGPIPVASVAVSAEINVTCRVASGPSRVLVAAAPPTPLPPLRTPGRPIQESWSGTATVTAIGPQGSSQAPLQLSGGVCLFFTTWTATARLQDVRVAD